jgi:hypothetical protein
MRPWRSPDVGFPYPAITAVLERQRPAAPFRGNCAWCDKPVYHSYPWFAGNKPLHSECFPLYVTPRVA